MRYTILLFSILLGSVALTPYEIAFSEVFNANEDDVYTLATFSQEDVIGKLLKEPTHAKFVEEFDAKFGDDFNKKIQYEKLNQVSVDDWELSLFEERNKQMEFLKSYDKYDRLSEEFIDLTQANINYNYWHLLLAYAINRSNQNTGLKQVTSLPRIMTSALDLNKINNPKRLLSKSYREFLPYFVTYFNSEKKGFNKYADGVLSMKDKAEFAEEYLRGDVLDYTLTRLIENNYKVLSTSAFRFWTSQVYCDKLKEFLSDSFYDELLTAETSRATELSKAKEKDTELPAIMDLNDHAFTFEKFKGKVVYVDFWASWCGPCRQEFPYSKAMHEGLTSKQKKEIVFLYISIDEDLDKWRGAVQKLGLEDFGENGHSYDVSIKYRVSSIPRYMVIDKKGILVNDNAPRPSSEETLPLLLELL